MAWCTEERHWDVTHGGEEHDADHVGEVRDELVTRGRGQVGLRPTLAAERRRESFDGAEGGGEEGDVERRQCDRVTDG